MEQEFQFFLDIESELGPQENVNNERVLKVRLDKWLWAARFFKTRAIARAAVEAGKVFYNGERSRPSREIEVGATIQIRHGHFEKVVIVKALSTRRRNTEESLQLFEETNESRLAREESASSWQQSSFLRMEQPKERRPVRFLRRSLHRGENRSEYNQAQSSHNKATETCD